MNWKLAVLLHLVNLACCCCLLMKLPKSRQVELKLFVSKLKPEKAILIGTVAQNKQLSVFSGNINHNIPLAATPA